MSDIDWSIHRSTYGCQDFRDADGLWVASYRTSDGNVSTQNHTRSGYLWLDLLKRTEDGGKFQQRCPAYVGVKLGFGAYQEFAEWAISQPGYDMKDDTGNVFQLDKDILVPGNKIYAPHTCAFVPGFLNSILNISARGRGRLPLGVSIDPSTTKYRARAKRNGRTLGLGTFSSAMDAHKAWQSFKAEHLIEAAQRYLALNGSRMDVAIAIRSRAERLISDCANGLETTCLKEAP